MGFTPPILTMEGLRPDTNKIRWRGLPHRDRTRFAIGGDLASLPLRFFYLPLPRSLSLSLSLSLGQDTEDKG